MIENQPSAYPLAHINLHTDGLSLIRNRRAVKRWKMEQDFASLLFKTITIASMVSTVLFGIGALACWRLEMNSQAIPTVNNRQDWQTRKQICVGWMFITFASLMSSTSLSKKSEHLPAKEIFLQPNAKVTIHHSEVKQA